MKESGRWQRDVLPKKSEHLPIPVVRVFLLAPRPREDILADLAQGVPIDEVCLTQSLFLRVTEGLTDNLCVVPGGEYDPDKGLFLEGASEVAEELTVLTDATINQQIRHEEVFESLPGFTYDIGANYPPRTARLMTLRVRSSDISAVIPREGENGPVDKIGAIIAVPFGDLTKLITDGSYREENGNTVAVAGHLTMAADTSDALFSIQPQEAQKKNIALGGVLAQAQQFEYELRGETIRQINKLRVWSGKPKIRSLADCSPDEFTVGYFAAQEAMNFVNERITREIGREVRGASPKARDLLRVVAYASAVPTQHLSELLFLSPTRQIIHALRIVRDGVRPAITMLSEALDRGEPPENPMEALIDLWPQLRVRTDKVALLRSLDARTTEAFASIFEVPQSTIREALRIALKFQETITENIKLNEEYPDYFQEHEPLNEIRDARLFTLIAMACGLHPNKDTDPNSLPGMRREFEAQRALVTFLVAVDAVKEIDRIDGIVDEFQMAIDAFLPGEPRFAWLTLPNGSGIAHNTSVYTLDIDGQPVTIHLDERGKKTPSSLVRKFFQESGEIHDLYTVNFAIAEDQAVPFGDLGAHLDAAKKIHEKFVSCVKSTLGQNGWSVQEIRSKKDTVYDMVPKLLSMPEQARRLYVSELSGKRAGSVGDFILRDKFTIEIEKAGQKHFFEVNIYPFETTTNGVVQTLGQYDFWGFKEKVNDNATSGYDARRIIARGRIPTEASLYEEYFAPFLDDELLQRIAPHQLKKRS